MKIIFVLDDQTVIVSSPEELQLRQIQPDLAALVLPAGQNEDKQDLFRPLVTYPVVLSMVPPKQVDPTEIAAAEATADKPKKAKKAKA